MTTNKWAYSLLIVPFVYLLIARCFWGFDGLYGQDSYEYLRYSQAFSSFMLQGTFPGDYFWPLYYPILGSLLGLVVQSEAIALQLISSLSLSISAYYLYHCILLCHNKSKFALCYVLLFYLLSPIVVRTGLVVMSDLLATCLIILSSFHSLKYLKQQALKSLYFALVFASLAIMTRYASFVVLLPFAFLVFFNLLQNRTHLKHLILLFFVFIILIFPHFYIRGGHSNGFLNHYFLQEWSIANLFKKSFLSESGLSSYSVPNILFVFYHLFHPIFLFVGGLLVPIFLLRKSTFDYQKVLLASLMLYAVFLAGIPFQNHRFLLLSFPFVLVLLYPSFYLLAEQLFFKPFLSIGIIITLQAGLIFRAMSPIVKRNAFEVKMANKIKPHQGNILYSFDVDIALKGRSLDFDYQNLWEKEYASFEIGGLVLFHPTKFSIQWKDKNPMINWNDLQKNYQLKTIEQGPQGWILYEIQAQ